MLEAAEARGENVVFVLDNGAHGGCDVFKVPVPGKLDRKLHFIAWFMHLTAFHGEYEVDNEELLRKLSRILNLHQDICDVLGSELDAGDKLVAIREKNNAIGEIIVELVPG